MSHPKEAWTQKNHWHCLFSSDKGHSPLWKQDSLNKTLPQCNKNCPKAQSILGQKNLANSSLSAVLHTLSSFPWWGRAAPMDHTSPPFRCARPCVHTYNWEKAACRRQHYFSYNKMEGSLPGTEPIMRTFPLPVEWMQWSASFQGFFQGFSPFLKKTTHLKSLDAMNYYYYYY